MSSRRFNRTREYLRIEDVPFVQVFRNEAHNVYIEVAPRQSGKTTRLIEKAFEHYEADDRNLSVIISSNFHEARRIRDMIRERVDNPNLERIKVLSSSNINPRSNIFRNIQQSRNTMFFFDEYEQMEDRMPILDNSYYVTSPRVRVDRSQTYKLLEAFDIDEPTPETRGYQLYSAYNEIQVAQDHNDQFRRNWRRPLEPLDIEPSDSQIEVSEDGLEEDDYLYRLGV